VNPFTNVSGTQKAWAQFFVVVLPLFLGASMPGTGLGTWLNVALGVVGAVAVYFAPAVPWLKIAAATAAAGLQVAVSAATTGGISHAEWNAIVLAAVGVAATAVLKNVPALTPAAPGPYAQDD
jgi:hypothetical protein